jgi:hypothetical protein
VNLSPKQWGLIKTQLLSTTLEEEWPLKLASDSIDAAHALLSYCTFIGLMVVGISGNRTIGRR